MAKSSIHWWRDAPRSARHALLAASLGWMLDSFDVMLYALVLSSLMLDLHLSRQEAGILGSITLLAAAFGGVVFGYIADRFGRTKALLGSILMYAIFTAACGFSRNMVELAIFRTLLGIGMGGEWASGASLVSETWPAEHRGKALGIVQSSWAVGYALAAITAGVILPLAGWRAVFFVGVLPALVTLFLRRNLKESEAWIHDSELRSRESADQTKQRAAGPLRSLFQPHFRGVTTALTLMNACTLFAWWGFNLWVPAYLSLPQARGGMGLSAHAMAGLIVTMQAGMWLGYISFGALSDRLGRKPCYVVYLLAAAIAIFLYGHVHTRLLLLALGPVLAFFGTGYFTGFGTVTSEIYPTSLRATALGFTYNLGRVASAAAPFAVGGWSRQHGFGGAFALCSVAFLLAAVFWIWIPETLAVGYPSNLKLIQERETP